MMNAEPQPVAGKTCEPVLCIVGTAEGNLWGKSTGERSRIQFARAGLARSAELSEVLAGTSPVVLVRSDAVIDQPLVQKLVASPGLILLSEGSEVSRPIAVHAGPGEAGAAAGELLAGSDAGNRFDRRKPSELGAGFWKALRKKETPYALIFETENAAAIEWRMFRGTYKGATDFVTKHLWPVPAFYATRWLAPRGVSPNMVTTVAAALTVLAFWLFLTGRFAEGLAAAWAMTFLDTVDGKLARTTLTSSRWGDIFDHGIDLVHPPFWYVAWALGLAKAGLALAPDTFWQAIAAILGGYVLQRIMEGIAIKWLGLEIHIWRPIDTLFRQVTARRNPNLAILTLSVLFGRPDIGLIAVAVWTVLCLALHGIQLGQALAAHRKSKLVSWMARP